MSEEDVLAKGQTESGKRQVPLESQTKVWATPTAQTPNALRGSGQDPEKRAAQGRTVNLQDQTSTWGTPRATTNGGNGSEDRSDDGKARLEDQVQANQVDEWKTPCAAGAMCRETLRSPEAVAKHTESQGRKSPQNLEEQISLWSTPTSRDWRDGVMETADVPTAGLLGRQVCRTEMWPTIRAHEVGEYQNQKDGTTRPTLTGAVANFPSSLPAPVIEKRGDESLSTTPSSPLRRRLNPLFVCWLMGLPQGWLEFELTNSERLGMVSYLFALRRLLDFYTD